MEQYLQYMQTLRTHMNDVEYQAAKISVEEEMQITTVQTLTKEIDLAKSETKRLKDDSVLMNTAKGDICAKLLERQKKIALLENDSSTLSQTLELIQQERVNLSAKLVEKRTSYGKTEEELHTKLNEQQEWLNSYKYSPKSGQDSLVLMICESEDDACKNIVSMIDAAKAKFNNLTQMRSELALESDKVKQTLQELKSTMETCEPKLKDMPCEALEEEVEALMSDKSAETEYQESVQSQIDNIKELSHMVKCGCGEEYKVLMSCETEDDACEKMVSKIDAAKAKFNNLTQMRSELALESDKVKQSLQELKCTMETCEPKLKDMLSEALEEEVRALMSDKSAETEYQESVQSQIDTIKELSHTVKCGCGEEYKVEIGLCV